MFWGYALFASSDPSKADGAADLSTEDIEDRRLACVNDHLTGSAQAKFIQLFFLDYAQEASDTMITLTWFGLLGGSTAMFFVAPEFFYFFDKKQTLSEILELDSRAEVMRRSKV